MNRSGDDDEMSLVSLVDETGIPGGNHRPTDWQITDETYTHTHSQCRCTMKSALSPHYFMAVLFHGLGYEIVRRLHFVWRKP